MNQDRLAGTTKNLGGKVQEGVGKMTGDRETEAKGLYNQAEGAAQDLYGQAKEGADTAMNAARDSAVTLEQAFRNTIEERPYMVVFGALALGWLLGRSRVI